MRPVQTSIFLFCLLPATAGAQGPDPEDYRLQALRVEEAPLLDGDLEDEAWRRAAGVSGFVQREPEEGAPATEDTEVKALFTDTVLYLSLRCLDSRPDQIRARQMRRDGDLGGDDRIEIILDTFEDGRNAYVFATTPLGVQWDAQVAEEGTRVNLAWDGTWQVAVRRQAWGWSAELSIPFATLRFPAGGGGRWGLNVQRVIRRKNEDTFWTPVLRGMAAAQGADGKYRLSLAGHLVGLEGVRPGSRLEVKPWGAVGRHEPAGSGEARGLEDGGLDLRLAPAHNLTADITFNTDFAQVEADQERINLDRFPLYFPEKREFFLEGRDLFSFGVSEHNTEPPFLLFHTRRVGLARTPDGGLVEVPIRGGLKLTGKEGPWSLGALGVRTGGTEAVTGSGTWRRPAATQGVVRLSRDVLGSSRVGLMAAAADHGLDGRAYAAGGVDAQFSLFRNTRLTGFAAASRRGEDEPVFAGALDYRWNTDRYGVEVANLYVDRRWGDDLGFVPRPGTIRNKVALTYSPRPDLPGVRQLVFFADAFFWSWTGGGLQSRELNPGGMVLLEDGGSVIFGVVDHYEDLPAALDLGEVSFEAGDYVYTDAFLQVASDPSRLTGGMVTVSGGPFFSGRRRSLLADLWWRPDPRWNAELILELNRVEEGEAAFRGSVVGGRLTWTPTVDLAARLFTQFNSERDRGAFNLLLSWRYRPRSHLYLVWDGGGVPGALPAAGRQRTLLLKATYLLPI